MLSKEQGITVLPLCLVYDIIVLNQVLCEHCITIHFQLPLPPAFSCIGNFLPRLSSMFLRHLKELKTSLFVEWLCLV